MKKVIIGIFIINCALAASQVPLENPVDKYRQLTHEQLDDKIELTKSKIDWWENFEPIPNQQQQTRVHELKKLTDQLELLQDLAGYKRLIAEKN